jgi:hypothetical protein
MAEEIKERNGRQVRRKKGRKEEIRKVVKSNRINE